MQRPWLAVVLGCMGLLASSPARAQPEDGEAAEAEPIDPAVADVLAGRAGFSHKGQVGVHLQGGIGYRGLFPYDGEYCGQLKDDGGNKANCVSRRPFVLDLGVGYGVTRSLELFAELRVGLESDFGVRPGQDGPRAVVLSPGIKVYIAEVGATQFFSTLQLPIDFTDYEQIDKNDFGVRNINGLQLDLHKTFGVFLFFGETVTWRRWLGFEVEAGFGAQVRFP